MKSNLLTALAPVAPVRPISPYIGGKRQLAMRLIAMINQIDHCTYAEVLGVIIYCAPGSEGGW
ncbi:hypothetical protein ACWGM0_05005 [Sphingomonas bisphenolicum]